MQLNTTRFGTLVIEPEQVITFTQPIIGFQEYRRFVMLPGPPGSLVHWLQSTDSAELAFLVMNPRDAVPDYGVSLNEMDLAELAAASPDEVQVYTLLVVPEDRSKVRTNLRAPLLVNAKQRLGKQMVLERSEYPIQFFLAQAQSGSDAAEEVTNARSDA